jgi:hypothetical protein
MNVKHETGGVDEGHTRGGGHEWAHGGMWLMWICCVLMLLLVLSLLWR